MTPLRLANGWDTRPWHRHPPCVPTTYFDLLTLKLHAYLRVTVIKTKQLFQFFGLQTDSQIHRKGLRCLFLYNTKIVRQLGFARPQFPQNDQLQQPSHEGLEIGDCKQAMAAAQGCAFLERLPAEIRL
jgi:hypothetical protein